MLRNLFFIVLLSALSGCQPATEPAQNILLRGNSIEPESLDPQRARGIEAANILRDLYEGLVREDAGGNLVPGVASHWTRSEDGLTWQFRLRADARWSNGEPVVAADFVHGILRNRDPATASVFAEQFALLKRIDAPDDHTLVIELSQPLPYLLRLLAHHSAYPLHRASHALHGEAFTRAGKLVSNGAFVLSEWRVNEYISLLRNPHYWNAESVRLAGVRYFPLDDVEAEFNRFRSGGLHITQSVPVRRFRQLQENYPDELKVAPYLGTYYFGLNLMRSPLQDAPALRRALSLVIDRRILAQRILATGEQPSWSLTPPGLQDYSSPRLAFSEQSMPERIAHARELYAAAGYSDTNPLQIEIRFNTGDIHRRVALAVAAMWQQALGVEAVLVNEEWRVFVHKRRLRAQTQVFRGGWIGDFDDPVTFLDLFRSDNPGNDSGYDDPEYDRLLNAAASTGNEETRRQILEQAERRLLAADALLPLYVYVSKHLVHESVQGWQHNLMDRHASQDLWLEDRQP